MDLDIRQLSLEESIKTFRFLSSYAFTPTPPLPDEEKFAEDFRSRDGATFFAVFEGDQPQAAACSTTPLRQNLHGVDFLMGGVADVCTHPAARRKGYVRGLMHRLYQQFKEKGMAVSCLYPFKEAFYQRLGYVTSPQAKKIQFGPECLKPILKLQVPGKVDLLPFKDNFPIYRQYLEKYQAKTHGMAVFSIPQSKAAESRETWLAVARQGDDIVGLMQYKLKGQMMKQELVAFDFLFDSPTGKYLLLDWIARHLDQVTTVKLVLQPGLDGETLFTDIRPEMERYFVAPMGRVIDIKALAGLPVGEGVLTISLVDPDCPWNEGQWRLQGANGQLAVEQSIKPGIPLSIQGLTALVYGVYDPAEFPLRGWGNPDDRACETMRRMFPPAIPFIHAMY
jgi:predicted acetyltransferase